MIIGVDAKIVIKRSSVASEVPTVGPSNDHTDGSWDSLDIYSGEFFANEADEKLFIRLDGTIKELMFTSSAINTIYSANDTVGTGRIITLTDTITFTGGTKFSVSAPCDLATAGGITTIGNGTTNYFKQTTNYSEQFSSTATFAGFHSNRNGNGIAMRGSSVTRQTISSTGTMVFQTNWDNNFNSNGTYAMHITTGQLVGVGLSSELVVPSAKLHVRGVGNDNTANAFFVSNSDDTQLFKIRNDGSSIFGTGNPDASALLELVSTTQGFRIMNMTGAQAVAITAVNGLVIYATSTSGAITSVGFWGYEAGAWVKL